MSKWPERHLSGELVTTLSLKLILFCFYVARPPGQLWRNQKPKETSNWEMCNVTKPIIIIENSVEVVIIFCHDLLFQIHYTYTVHTLFKKNYMLVTAMIAWPSRKLQTQIMKNDDKDKMVLQHGTAVTSVLKSLIYLLQAPILDVLWHMKIT